MRRLSWLAALFLMVSACAGDADESPTSRPSAAASTDPTRGADEYSLVGVELTDEELEGAGMTPVRTWAAACALLFDERDVPRLSVDSQGLDEYKVSELQSILMSVGSSGPDDLRDDAGQLVDHLDSLSVSPSPDPESLDGERLIADRMTENCERRTG